MPKVVTINCPHCAAPQSGEPTPTGLCECSYCGTRFKLEATLSPLASARPAPASRTGPVARTPPSRGARVMGLLGILVAAVMLGGLLWFRVSRLPRRHSRPGVAVPSVRPVVVTPEAPPPEVKATAEFTHHRTVRSYGTTHYVYGVVTNTSSITIDKPKVTVLLLDAAGRELDTKSGYAERDGLLPGESSPISILLDKPPAFASLGFEPVARKAFVEPRRAASLHLEARPPDRNAISSWVFKGKVRNDGSAPARFVRVLVTALDGESKIVGLASGYAEGDRLAAKSSARYEVMAFFASKPAPAKFELAVEGRPAD
jgi:hypothetical protein